MSRYSREGTCGACREAFRYFLVDSRANDTAYGYCDACGTTLLLGGAERTGVIGEPIEARLEPCPCGGRFRGAAAPRCPACRAELSAAEAGAFLEANVSRKRPDWRWQGSWRGPYCIVIENRLAHEPWPGRGGDAPEPGA